ncbi:MAG: hypothetical protein HOP08_15830 [Cyclobacteriaceae bacterium]|nr:hypothetical protein [Cyclobacteriaceae bacterium]
MKHLFIIGIFLCLTACGGGHKYHTVKVAKPIYHHTWYKNSRWHKKIQVGRIRVRWFEKQGVKTVKMKG